MPTKWPSLQQIQQCLVLNWYLINSLKFLEKNKFGKNNDPIFRYKSLSPSLPSLKIPHRYNGFI
jgi:hypothetical protein